MRREDKDNFFIGGLTCLIFFAIGFMLGFKVHEIISLW